MRLLNYVYVLMLLSVTSFSCTKEKTPFATSGDQIVKELQKTIQDNSIKRVFPVKYNDIFPDTFPVQSGTIWQFSNGFINVNYGLNPSYNLLFLRYYTISSIGLDDGSSAVALILYF